MSSAKACGLCFWILLFGAACDDEKSGHAEDSVLATGTDSDTARATDAGTESSTDVIDGNGTDARPDTLTDTQSDEIAESDVPPELPRRCTAHVIAEKVSGSGSGTLPGLSGIGDDMMAAFTYDPKQGGAEARVQIGYFDAAQKEWLSVYPFVDAVLSSDARMSHNATTRALVWREGRTEWDTDCTAETPANCRKDVAFATLTDGVIDQTVPIQVSDSGLSRGRPAAAPVSDGWVVVWVEIQGGDYLVHTAKVSDDGDVSAIQVVSSDEFRASDTSYLTVAALGDRVIATWWAFHQKAIYYVILDRTGAPVVGPAEFEAGTVYAPHVVAGDNGFLVSYGAKTVNDAEIFTRIIGTDGQFLTEKTRITWTDRPTHYSTVAHAAGMGYAISWLSTKANGSAECVDSACKSKVFAAPLDTAGALSAEPIIVSEGATDLNNCSNITLGTMGNTWVSAYEILRYLRQQILYSTFTCE